MSTLPRPFTPLIGREKEIAAISRRLESSGQSILTLVGPGGVGKTRLAVAVATEIADRFEDGAVYVDLSAVTDAQHVLPILSGALGIPDGEGEEQRLARALSDRSLLLVIDNFEQVRDAAPMLNSSLAGALGVRTLVTSQAPLRVQGEQEYAVEPLALPGSKVAISLETVAASPAVDLFVRRAQSVRPTFQLTSANAAAVAEICRRLDGLPLAIELAAARSNVLSPEALLHRLSTSLHILNSGPRDARNRHQALNSTIAWSYGLLPPEEALLLERLSVFAGSFALSAAEAVAGTNQIAFAPSFYVNSIELPVLEPALETARVFDLIDALVDHSLVQRVESEGEEPRFRLFTTIRQFAHEKLQARGEDGEIARRHALYFHSKAEAVWEPRGIPVLEWEWLGPLERDIDNFRAALACMTETDPARASTFAAALGWHFYFFGRRNEGVRAFERTDGRYDPAVLSPVSRARNHHIRGGLLVQFPERAAEGVAQFEAMLAEVEAIGLGWAIGFAQLALGITAEDAGDYDRAMDLLQRARPLLGALDDPPTTANVDYHLASTYFGLGRIAEARALVETIVALDPDSAGANLVYGLRLLGVLSIAERNLPEAAKWTLRYVDSAIRYDMGMISTEAVDATAAIVALAGDAELSALLFGAADRVNADASYALRYPERPIYDAARERVTETLGPERFQERYQAGSLLNFDAAIPLVRETLEGVAGGRSPGQRQPKTNQRSASQLLTRRELEVLQLVAGGMTDREIGEQLFISHGTARTHVGNIFEKLNVSSRSAATTLALREGIVRLDELPE